MDPTTGAVTQFCYVVDDLQRHLQRWTSILQAGPFYLLKSDLLQERVYRGCPAEDTFTAALGFLGATMIELIQPTNNRPSVFREILGDQAGAVHHVAPHGRLLGSGQYDAEYARLAQLGLMSASSHVIPGGGRAAFFDATEPFGLFIELVEADATTMAAIGRMYAAHVGWNGSEPVRSFTALVQGNA